ncbi:MipA/OmpV family protein [Massilia pseudoviolaceinigra]|uniref:MipA/OmpV family protein n=1 Tax=Massilia pseudoviolaceinigra TaxID=3057165 RepID=UPI0027967159|nr:MipA/OmpV family protein [Massilia sp. CCM 9206]MDQ1919446.1 MipA/OmpV family protein [Massilia sp. CCM 9206]
MRTLFALVLAGVWPAAWAQTPATNPMPDGSRDMYVGLGAVSAPRYQGAAERRVSALPLLQVEWSNGVFISGMSAGMHLSTNPVFEYGPLIALQPRRSQSGSDSEWVGAPMAGFVGESVPPLSTTDPKTGPIRPSAVPPADASAEKRGGNRLGGTDAISARLQGGAFFHYYLTPSLRITNNLLAGSGRDRHGATWTVGMQHVARAIAPHHTVLFSADLTLVNGSYNRSFFGVTEAESLRSGNDAYAPGGGLKDVAVSARWNWALSPSWMLGSAVRAARLQGDARRSPLVERPNNFTVSTGLAYRF